MSRLAAPTGDSALTLSLAPTEAEVRRALGAARQALDHWLIDHSTTGTVEIVLAEVLNNIVEHAFGGTPPGEILVWIERRPEALAIAVVDDGAAMPGEVLPAPREVDLGVAIADLPEGGFGWGLIHALSAGLSYRRMGERNRLAFRIPLTPDTLHPSS